MPKPRGSKRLDVNEIAFRVVQQAAGQAPPENVEPEMRTDGKNAAAVALGRLGGQKGGPARAKALNSKTRKAIAKRAAMVRWKRARKSRKSP